MLRWPYQLFSQFLQHLYSYSKWAVISLLLVLCISCSASEPTATQLNLSVQPERPGVYSVTGSTNLPEQSQITVSAIRRLLPATDDFVGSGSQGSYSILDRQIVEVKQGKWQATLNLWRVAPDGRLQEVWQLYQPQTGLVVDPAKEVSFVAIFDPTRAFSIADEPAQTPELQGRLVRFTNEGNPYVQASQTLQIDLPSGRRPPSGLRSEDVNGGWGNRYQLKPEPSVSGNLRPQPLRSNQTNAPLSPAEFLR